MWAHLTLYVYGEWSMVVSIMLQERQIKWSVAAGCLLAAGILVMKMITMLGSYAYKVWQRECQEVIYIQESPPPTRTRSSPKSSRRGAPASARRAGKKRLPSHKRAHTLHMDPRLPGHCGYACALHVAGLKESLQNVRIIRRLAAKVIQQAFLHDMELGGKRVREVVALQGDNLKSYLAKVEDSMWASSLEVAASLSALGVSCYYKEKSLQMRMGHGPCNYIICLRNKRYTVRKVLCNKYGGIKTMDQEIEANNLERKDYDFEEDRAAKEQHDGDCSSIQEQWIPLSRQSRWMSESGSL